MATNKHAIIRYNALDKCFSNTGKRYYIEDLLEACNEALFEFDPKSDGIKKRQLYDDIRFMESSQGFSAPIEKVKDGRRTYHRYDDSSFSIKNQPLNDNEADQIKSAMLVLNRFKGLPQFEWINELIPKLDQTFKLSNENQEIIGFDTNKYLVGTEYISPLFKAIQNKQALTITYQSFKAKEPQVLQFHPCYLKQYNNRWFLFGKSDEYDDVTNLALDRIKNMEHASIAYNDNQIMNFEEYFEDIIGVTMPKDQPLEKVVLKVSSQLTPYIKTKPLHGSQKRIAETDESFTFSIEVIPNYELKKKILSFGKDIVVVEPFFLREEIKEILNKCIENYN
ncbi:putative DNA-binding transcriptional regulator YafY [Kordia periserrulae]|uniref:Putative DNA-binding transcriptional regulator YafY n=1 Tax=Kordia periserrulae TaxID=701523 RepID=A0A2T6BYF3_9FLAO|nr:WYL domain-containing protein [Kordia periserrulae]PTX61111.1 putative DNA-binding transcriptional regulator YafY [Kordia periserrulae]